MLTQQIKLTRDSNPTAYMFGSNVALSGDGEYALVGGSDGIWIFSRRLGTWGKEGKLAHIGEMTIASNARTAFIGTAAQTFVVRHSAGVWADSAVLKGSGALNVGGHYAISHDAKTLLVGDGSAAAYVFVSGASGGWTEQKKLIAFGEAGAVGFGFSVALSADGNKALVGGIYADKQ